MGCSIFFAREAGIFVRVGSRLGHEDMAEVVHRNLELMLPELEELERSGIFSPQEIK